MDVQSLILEEYKMLKEEINQIGHNSCSTLCFNYIDYHNSQTITVSIYSLTEEQYRYQKALNTLDDENYEEVLMEPVSIPTNVTGGLGFVGADSRTQFVLHIP